MIHFYPELVSKTLETIKDAHDCADVLRDLDRIEQAKANIDLYGDCLTANRLNQELRQKYPCIDAMLNLANALLPPALPVKQTCSENKATISALEQDQYGILCDAAMKKGLVREIKQFIKSDE